MTYLLQPSKKEYIPYPILWELEAPSQDVLFTSDQNELKRLRKECDTLLYIPKGRMISSPLELKASSFLVENHKHQHRLHIHMGSHTFAQIAILFPSQSAIDAFLEQKMVIDLEEGARLELILLTPPQNSYRQKRELTARLKEKSHLKLISITIDPFLLESQMQIDLKGEESHCQLFALGKLQDSGQLHQKVIMRHLVPSAYSNQTLHTLLEGSSRSSFEGEIHVDMIAQKTQAYQMSRFLLLSKKAAAFTKPHLFIHADDVKASHGATISDLDQPAALLYLKSRGIPQQIAEKMLTAAFYNPILEAVPCHYIEKIKNWL